MKNTFLTGIAFIGMLLSSCTNNDKNEDSPQSFHFLSFEQDVFLPSLNEREILFSAVYFDENISNWEVKLSDGSKDIPAILTQVEKTNVSFSVPNSTIKKIHIKVPAFGEGDYTLILHNTKTNQIYSNIFLVRDNLFDKIDHKIFSFLYTTGFDDLDLGYTYFQNSSYTIKNTVTTSGIEKVVVEDKNTFNETSLDYKVDPTGKLEFTIPLSLTPGTYFLSVRYKNGLNNYFKKNIIVMDQKKPTIVSSNKQKFSGGEILVLNGTNFRYKINNELLPTNGITIRESGRTVIVFRDINGTRDFEVNDEQINSSGTELSFVLPSKKGFYFSTDRDGTYIEGDIFIRSGDSDSNPIPIRIDL